MENEHWINLEELRSPPPERPAAAESDARAMTGQLPTLDRRAFLGMVGLTFAAGALSGCRKPVEKIVPYLHAAPEQTPGLASWYATTCHGCAAGCGALVKVREGRPIKLEGNPEHPLSTGGLCAAGQGSLVSLYDSSRFSAPAVEGQATDWGTLDREILARLETARREGKKVALLTGTLTGPARLAAVERFLAAFPNAEHVVHDAVPLAALREAHRLAYGQALIPAYRFDRARVIVSFGADFLGAWLSPVEFARQYAAVRDPERGESPARHFQFEARLSLTGSSADSRTPLAPSEQAGAVAGLLRRVAARRGGGFAGADAPGLPPAIEAQLDRVAEALLASPGAALVVTDSQDVSTQLLVAALNEVLDGVGSTVDLDRPSRQRQGDPAALARLTAELARGEVGALIVYGCNPAYAHPEAAAFAAALKQVPAVIACGVLPDETAALARYQAAAHHPLEAWGDAEPQAGRYSLFQPTIRPLYDTRAFEESLLAWAGAPEAFHSHLQRHWREHLFPRQREHADFLAFWDAQLQRGALELAVEPPAHRAFNWDAVLDALPVARPLAGLEVEVFEPVALRDGAAAGNPWLQELPDPVTRIAWDNCVLVAEALAKERGIREGQWVEIAAGGRTLQGPVHVQPGQHPRVVSLALGYGREQAGPVGSGVGVDAYPLLGARQADDLRPQRRHTAFARVQLHDSLEGRPIVKEQTYSDFRQGKSLKKYEPHYADATLWPEHDHPDYHWGMAIDLSKCIGCAGCIVSCSLENNIPVVGQDEVRRQREMHWLRIDRYYSGPPENPDVVFQPMLCQHCENASCESVCPVLATAHDDQGLNMQVYNRCVGTRYCANNCPYKVRRFNFFEHRREDATLNLLLNPDVTVRSRGIMEKCTFCVQRIQAARIAARREGRKVAEGEVRTACQQSCPTDAIVFGNLNDPESRVSRLAESNRGYRVLEDLNRQPSIVYLARVRNGDEREG